MQTSASTRSDLISVIIPVYNGGEFLREALESLQTQTYRDFEAIMVNDGSTDDSEAICMELATSDSRFRLINQPNMGLSGARNTGIEHATGRWIAFLDADDTMPADALETLHSFAHSSNAEITAGSYTRKESDITSSHDINSMEMTPAEATLVILYQKLTLNNAWGKLYESSIFQGENPLRFRQCYYEDLDLFYLAFERAKKICIIDKTVYFYRDNPGSFINTWSDARLDVLDVTDRITEHMKGRSEELYRAAQDRRFSAHFNMLVEMERNGVDNKEQRERCLRVIKEQRLNELKDPNVRIKNKLGALISFLGMPAIRILCKF